MLTALRRELHHIVSGFYACSFNYMGMLEPQFVGRESYSSHSFFYVVT